MPARIKICGLKDEVAIKAVMEAKAEYAGFVYFPASPRHIALDHAAQLKTLLPDTIHTVSVLVDPSDLLLLEVSSVLKPDYLQLHGKETPERIAEIKQKNPGAKIIKGISVRTSDDVASAQRFAEVADMLLFDAKPPAGMLPGGNGLSFDWALLANREFPRPWFLSGGLNADNVAPAITQSGAAFVDVSSSVESSPGVKDPALIHAFVKAARTA